MGNRFLKNAAGLLTRRASWRFLVGGDDAFAGPVGDLRYAWAGALGLSLAWGVVSIWLWSLAWWLFGEPTGRLMPAAVLTTAALLGPPRRCVTAALHLLGGRDATSRALAAAVAAVVLAAGLASLQPDYYRQDAHLHWAVAWIRPWVKLHRVLLLMPLWGAWSMLITPQFVRPREGSDPVAAAFARGCSPLIATAVMGLLLALTVTYLNFLPWEQWGVSAAIILSAIAAGLLCCRAEGGLTRRALLAGNAVTQLAVLLSYLAGRNLLYW